ncbi:MAG TPA: NDP-sugar synthase [Microthrixaceae bacterium]|nr:NDP-sugar synthase [Microthrixaceae bacterium]
MKAVVLVGGFGTRLRPLTLSAPKQMLPLGRVTMLERVLAKLGSHGVTEVVLSLGYQPDAFIDQFPNGTCSGVSLTYAVEPEPLDTAGAIAFAAREAGIDETFLALNGDVLTDLDITALCDAHRQFGAEGTIALTPVEDPSRFGVVPIHADGRVEAFVEKPDPGSAPSNWINAGTYVLEPSFMDRVQPGVKVSIEREVFPQMVADGSLFALQSKAYWIDAGTPEAYLQAHLDLLDGLRGDFEVGIDPEARVDADAKVTRCYIGAGASVAPGCELVDSIVMAGARIGASSVVSRSIVGARSTIGEATSLRELSVVGFDFDVAAGSVGVGDRFPAPEFW